MVEEKQKKKQFLGFKCNPTRVIQKKQKLLNPTYTLGLQQDFIRSHYQYSLFHICIMHDSASWSGADI